MYTQAQMQAARRRTESLRRACGESGRIGHTGRHALRLDMSAYMNAVAVNGGVSKDGSTVWHDPEFVRDMKRRHPEINPSPDRGIVRGMVSRFGRVKERTYYHGDGSKEVVTA